MIYAFRTITVKDGSSMIDEPVVLYRGDKEIELVFGVLQQSFKFGKSENLIKTSKASHGQLIIEKLDGNFIFSNISECENGKIKFVMTDFMIDELSEVGIYDIQIRLYDETIHSRISIPPIKNAIEVREPLTVANPAVADQGVVNLSIIDKAGEEEEIFDEEGSYIKTEWSPGDTITSAKLNKIESSLETINNNDIQKDIDTNAKIDEITERLDTGDVNIDLSDYAKTVDIPTKTSELTNDSNFLTYIPSTYVTEYELNAKGYLTEHQDLSDYTKTVDIPTKTSELINDSNFLSSVPSEYITDSELNAKGYLTEHQDISNKADKSEIPTKTSQLTNDSNFLSSVPSEYVTDSELNAKGYLTEHQDLSDYAKTVDIPTKTSELTNDSNFLSSVPSEYVTEGELNAKGYLTEHQDISNKADKSEIPTKTSQLTNDSNFLSSVPSEYVTEGELNAKGYLTEHQDISNKVDKVSGKGLSTNDYTTAEKNKLAGIESGANKVVVWKANECTTFTSDSGTCTPLAVQKAVGLFPPKSHEHSQYLTEHQDLSAYAKTVDIPTKTSEFTNDSNFVSTVDLSSNLTLGYNTDGKLYIFFNGIPIGTGVEIATISGDVTGLIDENNDIILKGDLADGSYRIMYQYEDGSFSAPITVTVGEIETYANLLETAMEEGLTEVYNGIGYKANLRWSGSSSAFVSATKCVLTGLIPVGVDGDVLHIRGVDMVGYVDGRQSGWYHCYDSQGSRLQMSSGTINTTMISTDENGDITITMNHSNLVLPSGTAYIRFQFGEITGDFIMSRNFLIP